MALRIRFANAPGCTLGYSVERLSDGLLLDHADGTFKAAPAQAVAPIPEDSGDFAGRYKVTLDPTPAEQFQDGNYAVTIHDQKASNAVISELAATMVGGNDTPGLAAVAKAVADLTTELGKQRPVILSTAILPAH